MKVAVILSYYNWHDQRLYYVKKWLGDKGYNVKMYIANYNHQIKKRIEDDFAYADLIDVPAYKKNISLKRIQSSYVFAKQGFNEIKKLQPEIVYVLVPPNTVAYCANKYASAYKDTKLVIDVIDMWPESFPNRMLQNSIIGNIWGSFRNNALKRANLVISECNYYKKSFPDEIKKKTKVLWLFEDRDQDEEDIVCERIVEYESGISQKKIALCYLGTINNIIDLKTIDDILSALYLNGYEVELHIIGIGASKEKLVQIAEEAKCKVQDHGVIFDNKEKMEILSKCDFGLNCMRREIMVGLTVKSIDYLKYGLPIISNIKCDTEMLIKNFNIGIHYRGCKEELIEFLNRCDIKQLKENAFNCYLENFSKEAFEKRYKKILAELF